MALTENLRRWEDKKEFFPAIVRTHNGSHYTLFGTRNLEATSRVSHTINITFAHRDVCSCAPSSFWIFTFRLDVRLWRFSYLVDKKGKVTSDAKTLVKRFNFVLRKAVLNIVRWTVNRFMGSFYVRIFPDVIYFDSLRVTKFRIVWGFDWLNAKMNWIDLNIL